MLNVVIHIQKMEFEIKLIAEKNTQFYYIKWKKYRKYWKNAKIMMKSQKCQPFFVIKNQIINC